MFQLVDGLLALLFGEFGEIQLFLQVGGVSCGFKVFFSVEGFDDECEGVSGLAVVHVQLDEGVVGDLLRRDWTGEESGEEVLQVIVVLWVENDPNSSGNLLQDLYFWLYEVVVERECCLCGNVVNSDPLLLYSECALPTVVVFPDIEYESGLSC